MLRQIILTGLFLLLIRSSASAVLGLECKLAVKQYDTATEKNVLLYTDTAQFIVGQSALGTMLAFSVDIKVTAVDSIGASFMVHLVTMNQPVFNAARKFDVEYGLPAQIRDIEGKGDSRYTFEVWPIREVDIDTAKCNYSHLSSEDFNVDPTAHFNIYYVPFTHGDFYWNAMKGLMETEYERFKELNRFNLPGKYALYLCPCEVPSIIWGKRFGMMIDPTRSTMASVYNKVGNTTHPFMPLYISILRNMGYAPAFLAEGYAGYLSDAVWGMKNIREEGRALPLADMLISSVYFDADPEVSDRTAATFVRYLIEQYKISTFKKLYSKADDLNLRSSIEEVYGQSIAELESGWNNYLDTVIVKPGQLLFYADQAEVLFQYKLMKDYGVAALNISTNSFDSLRSFTLLSRVSLFRGDYYDAVDYQKALMKIDTLTPSLQMALGSFQMMAGNYNQAAESFAEAKAVNPKDQYIDFNIALNHLRQGDSTTARNILTGIVNFSGDRVPRVEARIILGYLMKDSSGAAAEALVKKYFGEAANLLGTNTRTSSPNAQQQMWNGMARLGLGDTGAALDFFETALYLESRSFYLGMINLWLGKLADVRGERDVAKYYYVEVINGQSADYHRVEAEFYLKNKYKQ